jgi:hypothetical protein
MNVPGLRSPYEKVGGLVHFGRMLDKISLQEEGKLPKEYQGNLGKGFDGRCSKFLHVDFPRIRERALQGGTDEEVLEWCFSVGRRPSEEEILVWNAFLTKRGWRDEASNALENSKKEYGLSDRSDIMTYFDLIKTDEE